MVWRLQLIYIDVEWWWRDITAALRPKGESINDITEDWDDE